MKILTKLYAINGMILIFYSVTYANWLKTESETSSFSHQNIQSQQFESDSLPEGVTEELLNDLRDENGNKIFTGEEVDAMQQRAFNGFAAADNYGNSASSAGDVNGDGYDDIIIGAPQNDAAGNSAGRAYIYYGGIIMNNTVDVILTGDSANNNFGNFVSAAGDVNGDGYSDVVVGAPGYSTNKGRAYIFLGGASMNNSADVIMTGETINNSFGYSVSTAGDVNGDGYSDVIVAAHGYSSFTGRAYIFYGGSLMNNVADVTMTGASANDVFGRSVSAAGDVNGDGFSDVIVSAPGYNTNTGRAYLFNGGSIMNNVADVVLTGESTNNGFGISVSSAGDVNGDGYSDVITGAYLYSTNTGRAYVFYGGSSMNNTADVTMTGETTLNNFGYSVSTAGDVNGDGYSDVVVGAYRYSSFTGRAYIFYGSSAMNNTSDIILTGEEVSNEFGYSVSTAGDVNGDGYSDMIVGAYGYNVNTGRAYVYTNTMTGEDIPDITMSGGATSDEFGISVSTAGDVNGDGYSDVIVGAYKYSSQSGRAYIFYGGSAMDYVADVTMTGETTGSSFGYSVSTAGDVNGDGYSDVIVGAFTYSSLTGRAYIFFGAPTMNNVADVVMTGEVTGIIFGASVSTAGDVNSDGYSDVIVGAPAYNTSTGRAYVFFGGSSMNNVADVTMTGEGANYQFGVSVSEAGDVNGDGYSDVIVGSDLFNIFTGRAYIFLGGSVMNNIADIKMTGEGMNDLFGGSVSTAGDVNGDGYSDVIVGAKGYNINTGKAYIFYGSSIMDNAADVIITGETTLIYVGISVSSAGDVNNDGYSDVIVGAYGYNSNSGRANILFGGSAMDNEPDITMTGEAPSDQFGVSVSAAGDVNGDGFPDLITGANQYNLSTGRAYIYMSTPPLVKPGLISVKDVPNDQGGYVKLKWMRSGYDVRGIGLITNYKVERSVPPGTGGYQWEQVGVVLPDQSPFYYYTATTPTDSGINGNSTYFFRITAITYIPDEFWRSNILSGYSVDNIAPPSPLNLTGVLTTGAVLLNWSTSIVPDFKDFVIYRNGMEIGFTTNLNFTDNTVTQDSTYAYRVSSRDIHGNLSSQSNSAVVAFTVTLINIKAIPEGFYNSATNRLNRRDTLRTYLRNISSPFNIIDSSKAVIDSATFNGIFKFPNVLSGTYYIMIKHRNTIETWSKSGGEILTAGATTSYDFTINASQSFGNNMKQVDTSPIRFAIYGGDVNQDGIVDLSDIQLIDNDASHFVSGYVNTDLNGDNFVDLVDAAIADNNTFNFVTKVTP